MTDVAELRQALQGIPDTLSQLPLQAVSQAFHQAYISFGSLMTGSQNPQVPVVEGLLRELGEQAYNLEGSTERIRDEIDKLTASM